VTTTMIPPSPSTAPNTLWARINRSTSSRAITAAVVLFLLLSLTRVLTDGDALTSSLTIGTTVRVTMPILLAGLAGLWAERVGVVNVGIEGMMLFGTWFGGYGAWQWGPWRGLLFGVIGGMLGGLIHAVAVIYYNVNHVISGIAINLFAAGAARYLSELYFTGKQGGGISQSPPQSSAIQRVNFPFLAGGEIGGWKSPDILGWFEERRWFAIADAAGILRGLVFNVSLASILAMCMVPLSAFVLWRTRFGLRVRSSGEAPSAAESLGVKVAPLRYLALLISGGLAGFGGAMLAIVSSSYYRQGQTGGRGFIGMATTIFGNWRPSGILGGATLFGFAESLQLVGSATLPKLFLFGSFVCGTLVIVSLARQRLLPTISAVVAGVLFTILFITVNEVPEPLTKSVPYVVTLLVLAAASQRLRPPAFAGVPFRSGEQH
jgi:general nucleoside transport system permease protein